MRENPPTGLTCMSVNKKRYIYHRKIFVIFHPFAEKPPEDGFARNFAGGSSQRRNHLFQIFCRSVEGFLMCAGSNFAILPLLSRSPITQGWRYRAAWDYIFSMVKRCVRAQTLRHIHSDIIELNCTELTNVTLHLGH